jgi:hypothetical protein
MYLNLPGMTKKNSNWETIKHGVPQCTILGPLLFIIYVNDLPSTVNTESVPLIFADDTSVRFQVKIMIISVYCILPVFTL